MLVLDISRDVALRSPAELQKLVEAVVAADPNDESRSVEWKSSLDLTAKGGAFAVARCILGMANRYPPQVENDFGGMGYMVVGAEPGNLVGLTPIDPVDLDNKMSQYLGTRHPHWSPQYIAVDGKHVLVVLIEPPQWGDLMWPLRKEWSDGRKFAPVGTVFVRGTAMTAPATDADIDKLQERIVRRVVEAPSLDLDVNITAPPLVRVDAEGESLKEWMMTREQMLRDYSSNPHYRDEVDEHMSDLAERVTDILFSRLMAIDELQYSVTVENPSLKNYPNVEMVLRCSDGTKMWAFDGPDGLYDELPRTPRNTGQVEVRSYLADTPPMPSINAWVDIDSSDDQPPIITLRMSDVRPRGKQKSSPFFLFVHPDAGDTVTFEYRLTSTRVDAVAEGIIAMDVSPEVVLVGDVIDLTEDFPA